MTGKVSMNGIWKDSCSRGAASGAPAKPASFPSRISGFETVSLSRRQPGHARGLGKHSVMPGQSAGHVITRSKTTKLSSVGRATRPLSFPRTRESSTGRDAGAYDLVAAGVPARHFPNPGSESGVTNDGQDARLTEERDCSVPRPAELAISISAPRD
jgi:hypothetical protein